MTLAEIEALAFEFQAPRPAWAKYLELKRLVALVPPARLHLASGHGVYAANSALRSVVLRQERVPAEAVLAYIELKRRLPRPRSPTLPEE